MRVPIPTLRFTTAVLALLLVIAPALRLPIPDADAQAQGTSLSGYWHTQGVTIVNGSGHRVRIAGLTWYGMETVHWVPAGLEHQPYTRIMSLVKSLGYNTIRLPLSNQLIETNPVVSQHVKANRQFRGMHALAVLDALVRYAGKIGLKIILNDQISRAERSTTVNILDEPLWYTTKYPESAWINDWKTLARRYRGNSTVIGVDLRNEPHTAGPGPWSLKTYLRQGATWGPYNRVESPRTDWRLAAQRAGNAVLSVNPHLLIFVEGIQLYPSATQPRGVATGWWGWNLSMVPRYPVVLKVPHHLVYSPHDWGPRKAPQTWFTHMTYGGMKAVWHSKWSFLLDNPKAKYAAPVLIGEFGTCTDEPQCVNQLKQGNQAQWFHFLLRFLKNHPAVGWDFFALNGSNANDSPANNGLLSPNWDRVANQGLQNDLASIQH